VRAVALNTAHLSEEAALAALAATADATGLPCADMVRAGPSGADRLVAAFLEFNPAANRLR